ncbi:MAG: type II toxin-antitoxin system Phd/YefM family antitoxin [Candidatus Omnitrophota bacterium]
MIITATQLRKDIYRIIDRVAQTGAPVTITRKGQSVMLFPAKPVSRLSRLKKRAIFNVDPEEIVHMDWSGTWKPSI